MNAVAVPHLRDTGKKTRVSNLILIYLKSTWQALRLMQKVQL